MLQVRFEIDKFFEDILKLTNHMDPVLAEINQLLDDVELYQLIRDDFARRFPLTEQTCRNSTPVEVASRMLAVKQLYGLSYEQTKYQVRDSLVLRKFCRVYFEAVPDDTTLIRWVDLVQPETLERFNHRLTQLATQLKVTKGRKLCTDGTVVETNIHHSSDSSLLSNSVRVLGHTLSLAKETLKGKTDLGEQVFRNRIRSVRRLARQVREAIRKGGETAKTEGKIAYRKLVKAAQATIQQAQQALPTQQAKATKETERLATTLETFIPRDEQVVNQTVRRVFHGEKVPAAEKIVSNFEPHSDIVRRNKACKPTEYAHKVWLDEVDGGVVTHWKVVEGNPSDDQQWVPNLEHHMECFGRPPKQMSADRGVQSPRNERIAQERGVKRVILPQPGRKREACKQH